MIMETTWVGKEGEEPLLIELRFLEKYEKAGWQKCKAPASQAAQEEPEPPPSNPVAGLVELEKDGATAYCTLEQVAAMTTTGWKVAALKTASDAEAEDPGDQGGPNGHEVDQEHGSGEDGGELELEEDG